MMAKIDRGMSACSSFFASCQHTCSHMMSHLPSHWLHRSPSFDGIHARDLPEGMMMRNPAGQDYIILKHTWRLVHTNTNLSSYPDFEFPERPKPNTRNLETTTPPVKRPRGRPRKRPLQQAQPNESRVLTAWQSFMRQTIPSLKAMGLTSQQQMRECARRWAASRDIKS